MKPDNVKSVYVSGKKLENLLFQCALHWAEKGQIVWFITPTKINNLPILWENPPSKEVLKLIIIMYITNRKDLLTKFNEIHLWQKLPKIVVIMELDTYLLSDDHDYHAASFLLASILDGMSTCSLKINSPTYLITSCNHNTSEQNMIMNNIIDLFFSYCVLKGNSDLFEELIEIFNK